MCCDPGGGAAPGLADMLSALGPALSGLQGARAQPGAAARSASRSGAGGGGAPPRASTDRDLLLRVLGEEDGERWAATLAADAQRQRAEGAGGASDAVHSDAYRALAMARSNIQEEQQDADDQS